MPERKYFKLKQFAVRDENSAMKVGTDAVILGAWCDVAGAKHILDIGTGCGIIALMTAQRSHAVIDGIDIHSGSVIDAQFNFRNSLWSGRLNAFQISLQEYSQKCDKRYDLIISNPPFFANSLKSPCLMKNIAKHNDLLPFDELIESVDKLLTPAGRFFVIVPANVSDDIENTAMRYGMQTIAKLNIYPKPGKALSRKILEFGKNEPAQTIKEETIYIREAGNGYSLSYKNLTGDFLLGMR